ncbi:hypothetical protein [Kibdelosporangium aridum]|uniref:hypothetical protein n=1 Tax=Kibdelosporangium aridum TaxID=2030 RepID=UPI0035EDC51D
MRPKTGILIDKSQRPPRRIASPGIENLPDWLPAEEIRGAEGAPELLVSVSTYEEKGADVNVASHLLIDVLTGSVDAAMVFRMTVTFSSHSGLPGSLYRWRQSTHHQLRRRILGMTMTSVRHRGALPGHRTSGGTNCLIQWVPL